MTLLLIAFIFLAAPLQVSAQALDVKAQWKQTLQYGIDSQVLDTIQKIKDAKDATLTPELTAALDRSGNADVRKAILDLLTDQKQGGGEQIARGIVGEWADQKSDLVVSALHYLSAMGAQGMAQVLVPLMDSPDNLLATESISALGKTGDRSVTPLILEKLSNPDFPEGRKSELILALGDLRDPSAVDTLIALANDEAEDKTRRLYAADALGKIGDAKAIPVLKNLMKDGDALSRAYAASALVRFDLSQVIDELLRGLRDDNWKVRSECAKALARHLPADTAKEIVAILSYKAQYDPVSQVRLEAMNSLAAIGSETSLDFLLTLYTNTLIPMESRERALSLIAGNNLSNGVTEAIRAAVDSDFSARNQKALVAAAKVLSAAKSQGLKPVYMRFLESPDPAVRLYAIKGIELNLFSDLKDRLLSVAAKDPLASVQNEARNAAEKL